MINLTFAHTWQAEVLPTRPLILPSRQYVYPVQVEEVERGAMEVMIRPSETAPQFLATCALGFADPAAPSGVWACPDPAWICIVAGGYAYLIDTRDPARWHQLEYRPVVEVWPVAEHNLLLFSSFHAVLAWGTHGEKWRTRRLSWDGLRITEVRGNTLHGVGWDMKTDQELPFAVNLQTGEHTGGGYLP